MFLHNQDNLKKVLRYDPATGNFYWLVSPKWGIKSGDLAGSLNKDGYTLIMYKRVSYRTNRLAWLYMTGVWPINEVDHIDTDRSNDIWSNLRQATDVQNAQNRIKPCNNTSGVKGIFWDKKKSRWVAAIQANNRRYNVGTFTDFDKAVEALNLKRAEVHGTFANIGELSCR